MAKNYVRVYNTVNGQIQEVPKSFLEQSKFHTPAAEDSVSFDPNLYTPKTRQEFENVHKRLTEPAPVYFEPVYVAESEHEVEEPYDEEETE